MKLNTKILLNEILRLSEIENVKIRFNLMFDGNWRSEERRVGKEC